MHNWFKHFFICFLWRGYHQNYRPIYADISFKRLDTFSRVRQHDFVVCDACGHVTKDLS